MAILQEVDGQLFFKHGKYKGKSLDEIAQTDPTYLQNWLYPKASDDLTDEVFRKLVSTMGKYGVEITKVK